MSKPAIEVPLATREADRVLLEIVGGLRVPVDKAEARYADPASKGSGVCAHCKFFLADSTACLVVVGAIQPTGTSRFFSTWEEGLYPGDAVWEYVKAGGEKLARPKAKVAMHGTKGFQCGDCKYLLYSGGCLIVKGLFKPEMTCAYFVPVREGRPI